MSDGRKCSWRGEPTDKPDHLYLYCANCGRFSNPIRDREEGFMRVHMGIMLPSDDPKPGDVVRDKVTGVCRKIEETDKISGRKFRCRCDDGERIVIPGKRWEIIKRIKTP